MFTLVTVVATRVVTLTRSVAMHHRIEQSSSVHQPAQADQQIPRRRKPRSNRKVQLLAWITALGGASGLVQIIDSLKQKFTITVSMQAAATTDDSARTQHNAHTPLVIKANRHGISACEEY